MQEQERSAERRSSTRFTIGISATCVNPALDQAAQTYTHDISTIGIGILTKEKMEVGSVIEICIQVADNSQRIMAKGRVIWQSSDAEHNYRTGIQLDGPTLKPIALILSQLRSNMHF
ncbi:MAG: PilZ domain-containing protein [Candidatus Omnitrophica bacterium]|nr:PilZ domain-containing protein [Candidatus Omnitrophota bacterium]